MLVAEHQPSLCCQALGRAGMAASHCLPKLKAASHLWVNSPVICLPALEKDPLSAQELGNSPAQAPCVKCKLSWLFHKLCQTVSHVVGHKTVCHVKAALPVMLEIAMVKTDKLLKPIGVPHSGGNGPDKLVLISWRWVRDGKEPLSQDAGSVPVIPTPCI